MNVIDKVSDITAQDVAEYLRIAEPTTGDINFINTALTTAKDFILKYTGIPTLEELDEYKAIIAVVWVLCQDMYDNKVLYVDNSNVNKVVETTLGLYQRNLL
jgi:hypothetical protein